MTPQALALVLSGAVFLVIWYFNRTDTPKIKDIPEIPGVPIFGNLWQLGEHHAKVARSWVKKYGPVFQVRLGNKRIIYVNSFDSVKHFWITHQSALISRPTLYTFHSVVSSSQGFTIGTSPWDESCKQRRKAAATALNRPAVQSYMPIIDLESTHAIRDLYRDSQGKDGDGDGGPLPLDPRAYFQRYALNTSLTLNYGIRIEGGIDDSLLHEIVHVERMVSNFRSTSNNWQDYVPLLRLPNAVPFLSSLFSSSSPNSSAASYRHRRDIYMNKLLSMLKSSIASGTDKPCITGTVLKDPDAKLNDAEIASICLTMVSAGIDTIPGNLIMTVALLGCSGARGQAIQSRAHSEILAAYPQGGAAEAWTQGLVEEKVPYITALVKETLRFWTVIPICLPRKSVKDIPYQNTVVPAGTTFYMNAYAADYDEERFRDPFTFDPERYLDGAKKEESAGTPHYGYGAGSRMCAGTHLANRELYTAFLRLIAAFRILPAEGDEEVSLDALDCNAIPTSLTTEPKPFRVRFEARDRAEVEGWLREGEERTRGL
ncbi:MAG: hypothetical protein Q9160_007489 [Pyrenula sp. 1 TL-2023]